MTLKSQRETPRKIADEFGIFGIFAAMRARPEPVPVDLDSMLVTGKFYRGTGQKVFYCESHEERHGFWMAEVDPTTLREFPGRIVTCVSERAPGRTFHLMSEVR